MISLGENSLRGPVRRSLQGLLAVWGSGEGSNTDGSTESEEADQQSADESDETEGEGKSKEAEVPDQPSMRIVSEGGC